MRSQKRLRPRFDILEKRLVLHSSGDTDIQVGYDAGNWTLDLLLAEEMQGVEVEYTFDPAITPLTPGPLQEILRPADPKFDFTGAAAGERIHLLPALSTDLPGVPDILTIALSAEPIATGIFAEYTETDLRIAGQSAAFVKLHLVDVRGPGHFSVWTADGIGDLFVWMATSDGIDATDLVFLRPRSHGHFNLGFSKPGKYEIDLKASGYLGPGQTNEVESPIQTYTFIVRDPIVAVTGADKGSKPLVKVIDPVTGNQVQQLRPYAATFRGGVRVATGDVNGDGHMDIVTAPGGGISTLVRVYDGATNKQLPTLKKGLIPYGKHFTGGAWVAVGDLDGQSGDEIVVGPGKSARPVKVYDETGAVLAAFQPFGAGFTGGVRVAIADGQIVCAQASGASAIKVLAYNAGTPTEQESFTAFAGMGGAYVATGDVDGDGTLDYIVGAGLGNGLKVFDGGDPSQVLLNFPAYISPTIQGVRVAAADLNYDGRADLIVSPGPGKAYPVRILNSPLALEGVPLEELFSLLPNGTGFLGGNFIASGVDR